MQQDESLPATWISYFIALAADIYQLTSHPHAEERRQLLCLNDLLRDALVFAGDEKLSYELKVAAPMLSKNQIQIFVQQIAASKVADLQALFTNIRHYKQYLKDQTRF